MNKNLIEIGIYSIRAKGKNSFTLAAPREWMKYAGAKLHDQCIAIFDKRDNSLHFYLSSATARKALEGTS